MKRLLSVLVAAAALAAAAVAAPRAAIVVSHDLDEARPAETVVVPFLEIAKVLGADVPMHHILVREAQTGRIVASQVTNFQPDARPAVYDHLLFQCDFPAGQKTLIFTVERTADPVPPFVNRVSARHVPERLDDFAWENDRVAHRIYGAALATDAAGGSKLTSSGIDVWAKRVRYPIVDRWYLKGHDAYHVDTGEGLDLYTVRTGRGCGGTGVWADKVLHTSANWASARVLANGPIRAVFEITYAPWSAGEGVTVAETKRFTVDAGRNLDVIESTWRITGGNGEATVAIGLLNPPDATVEGTMKDEKLAAMTVWQAYPKKEKGAIGVGAVLVTRKEFAGFVMGASAADAADKDHLTNHLLLVRVKDGETIRYAAGAGWDRSGDFAGRSAWEAYVQAEARRLAAPVRVLVSTAASP